MPLWPKHAAERRPRGSNPASRKMDMLFCSEGGGSTSEREHARAGRGVSSACSLVRAAPRAAAAAGPRRYAEEQLQEKTCFISSPRLTPPPNDSKT